MSLRFYQFLKYRPRWFYFAGVGIVLLGVTYGLHIVSTQHGVAGKILGVFLSCIPVFAWLCALCAISHSIERTRIRKEQREEEERENRKKREKREEETGYFFGSRFDGPF